MSTQSPYCAQYSRFVFTAAPMVSDLSRRCRISAKPEGLGPFCLARQILISAMEQDPIQQTNGHARGNKLARLIIANSFHFFRQFWDAAPAIRTRIRPYCH